MSILSNIRTPRTSELGETSNLVLPEAVRTADPMPILPKEYHFVDARPEVLPADPNLRATSTNAQVVDALPAIRFRVDNMREERPGLNTNIVPQLIGLLRREHEEIPIIATQILKTLGSDLSAENRTAARTALQAYRRRNTNLEHQTIIDETLQAIPR